MANKQLNLGTSSSKVDVNVSGSLNIDGIDIYELLTIIQSELKEKVPNTRTINNKELSANIVLSASDVGAYSKSETDNIELITVEDIDAIFGISTK